MNPFPNPLALTLTVPPAATPIVTAASGAVQAVSNTIVPVDPSAGPAVVLLPPNPIDLAVVVLSVIKPGASTAPVTVEATGVTTLGSIETFDPSWSGVGSPYVAMGHIADDSLRAYWFVFLAALNAWVPGN